jgi:HK97 family phage prohead protease
MSTHGNSVKAFEVASFKASDETRGEFEALVSVFGNVDHGGERVVKGAFAKTLNRWREHGDPIPVIWNHMWDNPEAHIGKVDAGEAAETDDGLLVKGTIDLDNPFAAQVYRLLKERRVKEFSFGYALKDSQRKDGALELREIELFELGPTLKGMNPETELLAVKSLAAATAKAGARHSKETLAALHRMRAELDQLIAAGEPADEPKSTEAEAQGKASDLDADIRTQLQLTKEQLWT